MITCPPPDLNVAVEHGNCKEGRLCAGSTWPQAASKHVISSAIEPRKDVFVSYFLNPHYLQVGSLPYVFHQVMKNPGQLASFGVANKIRRIDQVTAIDLATPADLRKAARRWRDR